MRLSARGWQNSSLERGRKNGENPKKQKKHFRAAVLTAAVVGVCGLLEHFRQKRLRQQ